MGKASAPTPPDYTPVAMANLAAAKISQETAEKQLVWAKEQYADQAPHTKAYMQAMTANAEAQTANAQKAQDRYATTYQPIEDSFVNTTNNWNSTARSDQNAGAAEADVASNFDQARKSALQNLESYGIDPSTTRFGALDLGTRISQAAATAGAGTQSRLNTMATGLALQGEAINTGKGYPGNVAQSYAGATNAGGAGISAGLNTSSTYGNLMGTPTQWNGVATNERQAAATAIGAGYGGQMSAANFNAQQSSQMSSGIGALAGAALTAAAMFS